MKKPNPVCEECSGWLEEVRLSSGLWYRCRSCGFMKRVVKTVIKSMGRK